jgi:hypothetical protein
VPDVLPAHPYVLRQKAGTLMISSTPPGAAIWHGTQLLGITPALITRMPPGTYELRLVAPGCEGCRKSVTISDIRGENVEIKLRSHLGSLELQTEPPGCIIAVDGLRKGQTGNAGKKDARISAPFLLPGLTAGDHLVRVEHPCGAVRSGRIRIAAGEVTHKKVKLWIPDCKLVLNDGTACVGMMIETNEHGDVVIEEKPKQYKRYLEPRIAEVKMLSPEQIKETFDRIRGIRKHEPEAKEASDEKNNKNSREREKNRTTKVQEAKAHEGDAWGDDAGKKEKPERGESVIRLSSKELHAILRNTNKTELHHRLKGKEIVITAIPTSLSREGMGRYVAFGRRVRCFLTTKTMEESAGAIRAAIAAQSPLTIHGIGAGIRGDLMILRNTTLAAKK